MLVSLSVINIQMTAVRALSLLTLKRMLLAGLTEEDKAVSTAPSKGES